MNTGTNKIKRLLVFEDDEESADLIRYIFKKRGYVVSVKDIVDNYINDIAVHRPHVILLDLRIPTFGGEIVCRKIKGGYDIPVILYSADFHLSEIGVRAKADDWIRKPFRIEEIFQAVERQYYYKVVHEAEKYIKSSGKKKI